jgi:hypothetical protein
MAVRLHDSSVALLTELPAKFILSEELLKSLSLPHQPVRE